MNRKSELLAEVASLYYKQNFTQKEIADRLFTSRSTISRLLQEAKEKNIVEITIHHQWERLPALEKLLQKRFNIKEIRVVNSKGRPYNEVLQGIGTIASQYIDNVIKENTILGITWGKTMYNTLKSIRPKSNHSITAVQVIGATASDDPTIDSPDLVRQLAFAYGGKYYYLHAPLYVADDHARKVLIQEPAINATLSIAKKANIILTGIGSIYPKLTSTLWTNFLSKDFYSELLEKNIVGHLCAYFFDIKGNVPDIKIHKGIVGIDIDSLRNTDLVIGVAGGENKAEAIIGALRSKLINVLITDDSAASKIIRLTP